MQKKITRGITKEFADVFKKSQIYNLYREHSEELIIGVRNDYLNLYYNCDSIAKIIYKKKEAKIICEIDRFYLFGKNSFEQKKQKLRVEVLEIYKNYQKIKNYSNLKATSEKKAQSQLVILNNRNQYSKWYCIDVEYVKQFHSKQEKTESDFNGRFDIIALSKEKPHRVAIIELKYGSDSIGGKSGVNKHVKDFINFREKGYFENHLRKEVVEIVKSLDNIGMQLPFSSVLREEDILPPEYYFITLDNNPNNEDSSTPQQTMAGYLFNKKRWGSKKIARNTVESTFGDITKKTNNFNATFLFSKSTIEKVVITDIIDGDYDEKIIPN